MIFPQSWKFHKVILSPPRIKPQSECPLLIRPAKPQFLISSSPHQILIYSDISLYQVTSAGPCTEPLWEHPSLCCTQVPPYKIFRKEDMFNSRKIYSQKQGAISCATARPPVSASTGALTLAGSPSIHAIVAKSILSRFTRFWMYRFQPFMVMNGYFMIMMLVQGCQRQRRAVNAIPGFIMLAQGF